MRQGQKGTLTHIWAQKGTRPTALRQTEFDWAYLFGAVCPESGKSAGLVMPEANTETMNQHLLEISKQVSPRAHAIVLMDRAGWHRSKSLRVPQNLTIMLLPPRSPELNPVEIIWHWLRSHWLSNRLYINYEAIVDACCQAWKGLVDQVERIRSLCSFPWITCAETF
jgi:transposase